MGKEDENRPYYDKGGHKERSLYHQPNHAEHWKKQEKKQKLEEYRRLREERG